MTICKNLIGDTWLTPTGDASFESRNPANPDDILGIFPMATREDARQAIDAARQAFPAWSALPAPDRGAILDKASQLIDARLDDLAIMLTREEGKTRDEAKAEMIRARDVFRYYSGEGWRPSGQVLPSSILGEHLYTQREPLGVISIITPWNFPAAIPAWKIAPALVYGNTVVFKPASDAPRIGLILVEILLEAGVPFGVINFITGSGKVVGDELCGNDGINGISFTGSYKVGSSIYNLAVKNMTRVQLEMGGKNPLIVLNDADLDLAVPLAVKGGFGVTGQACTASSRVIVEEGIADDFAGALAEAARNLVIGDGLEEKTQMGPAASQSQLETDLYYSKVGQDEGAKLLAGGEIAKEGGYYVQPTVFDQVEPSMRIAQEEIFGPVIGIIRVNNLNDAIEKANDIGFGLSAGIVTNDMKKAFTFTKQIEAGVVKINAPTSGIVVHAPFGGFKHSSANTFKEQGQAAIEFFTRTKTVYVGHG